MKRSDDENLEMIIRRMQADRSYDAPSDVLTYSKNLFRSRIAQSKPSLAQRVAAVLRVDLAPGKAAFGERSAGAGRARQMLFDSGENAVDLRLEKNKNGFAIHGQILGEGFDSGRATLSNADTQYSAKLGRGEFKFALIPAGEYTLLIEGTNEQIVIESLPIN